MERGWTLIKIYIYITKYIIYNELIGIKNRYWSKSIIEKSTIIKES